MKSTKQLTLLVVIAGVSALTHAQYYQVGGFAYSVNNSGVFAGSDAGADSIWKASTQATTVIGGSLDAGVATISCDGRYVGGTAVVAGNVNSQMARYIRRPALFFFLILKSRVPPSLL